MTWFQNATDIESLKKEYRSLAKKHHPDMGGDIVSMQQINAEYEKLFERYNKAEGGKHDISDGYREVINKIMDLDGLEIEICGAWIWVSGETRTHKETLKAAGFWWANKKAMWYWRPAENRKQFNSKPLPMDVIRLSYGSELVKSFRRPELLHV